MNGVINVYKEKGYTSHDVVAKLRGILRQRKIGHTGTLDPQAEGVLPVCLGSATKLCDMLTDKTKEYKAVMRLGVTTDTLDLTGEVLSEKQVNVSKEQVEEVVKSFVGKSEQIPPMYSALKVNGKKLYELAREGKTIERKARPIEIYSIEILDISLPDVTFLVNCSKGTYIRTLCDDMGAKLGCGAAMADLVRTRVERFEMKNALTLSQIEILRDEGKLEKQIVSVEAMFDAFPKVIVKQEFKKLIDNGNSIRSDMIKCVKPTERKTLIMTPGEKVRIYNEDDIFYGIFEYDSNRKMLKPDKFFLERND